MKPLNKFCFCMDLRSGSFIIYVVEFLLSFYAICLGQWSSGNTFLIVNRVGAMIFLIGNVCLLMGIIYKSPRCLLVYLISTGIHLVSSTIHFIIMATTCRYCYYVSSFILFTIVCISYFWFVVYSFRDRCKWERSINYDGGAKH